jgi:hypothetical protein
MKILYFLILISTVTCLTVTAQNNKFKRLPKILIIGDSISLGYTPFVSEILKDQALLVHNKGNAEHTGTGLQKLDAWLGDTPWNVIHFNWGLWDLCYRHPQSKVQGNRDKANGILTTSLEQYEENLDLLVARLRKTGAKLIWAHTTFVPEGEAGRFAGDDAKYNQVATKVMKKHGIPINNLHSQTMDFSPDLFVEPGNVHYTIDGYRQLAQQVAKELISTMQSK